MIGDIYKATTPVSGYQPSKDVCDFTDSVRKDFSHGMDILNRPYVELNNLSPIERDNRDQRTFNAFVDEDVEDPNTAWQYRGTRSKARNKAIAMHSQLTTGYIVPMFMAQDDNNEEDRGFSDAMRDVAEWIVHNSNYKSSFLLTSMGMLVNCVTYLGAEYAEIYQTIKERLEDGSYSEKEILDDVLSGFQAPVYSTKDILISNVHEQNIQRQRVLIKRRYIEYAEAKAKYGHHENFEYVCAGTKSVYSAAEGVFYDVKDDSHPSLVEEAIYMGRQSDTEVCFLGGIYMGDEEVFKGNAMRHRDNRGAPKYNVVPYGYQRINEHFYFYKSLMNSQYWDNALLDAQYEVGMNRAFLDANMPLAVTGSDSIDSSIVFPNSVVAFEDKDVKITPLLPAANLGNLFAGMSMVEKSIEEGSVTDMSGGQLPGGDQKATGIAIAERNAQILLKGVGKTLAESTVQFGALMADIIVNHITVPQVMEIVGDNTIMNYPTFILKDKTVKGKNTTKVIKFDQTLLGKEMTKDERKMEELKMLEGTDYPNHAEVLTRINPDLFSRMKYLIRCEPELMFPKNEEFQKAMYTQIYSLMQNNPYISLESLTRKTMYQFLRGETEDVMKKADLGATNVLGTEADPNATGSPAGNTAVAKAVGSGIAPGGKA